ncbi:NAD(P)-dependent alcohol dehydrogenase [Marinobacter halotolerans]|uniref:NAD(P)-dependent alcohol dehydrogenase n=1 Tax=Marinobacter halotolerans TaxID=1569211 RepID=UPI001247CC98|nr:NAD(P)-dependent alcohol dehydrogenase [Marinobacter halotolerans]
MSRLPHNNEMNALIYRKFGSAEVLEWASQWPAPELTDNGVLVRVVAGSVNPKDVLLRKGKFSKTLARDPLPRVSGLDCSGEILAVGKNVTGYAVGDRVFGMTNRFCGGLHAEVALLDADEICPAPGNISLDQAASVPLAALTALQALRDLCKVQQGHRVLINGASGGVGHFAVQIAKAIGAEVHAVCGPDNLEFVKAIGADAAYSYRDQAANELSQQFEAVFDVFGKFTCKAFSRQLGKQGIFVSTVPKASTILPEFLAKTGLARQARLVIVKSRSADLAQLKDWIEAEKLVPHVDAVYPVTRAGDAHRHVESRHTVGKVCIRFVEDPAGAR